MGKDLVHGGAVEIKASGRYGRCQSEVAFKRGLTVLLFCRHQRVS